MNRRQLIKTALVALPSGIVLGRSAAPLAQEGTLAALHAVLDEIGQTNAWRSDMAERYHEIRSGALAGTYLVQLLDNTGSGSRRTTPANVVSVLLPHDYHQWGARNSPMLSEFVSQNSEGLATAINVLYDRRGTDYSDILAGLGIAADGTVATNVFSGAMVAAIVGLAAVFRGEVVPGLDTNGIDTDDITGSLETIGMGIYPC